MAVDQAPSQRGLRLDFTINIGHVLTMGGVIITMIIGWVNFDNRLMSVEAALRTATDTFISQVRLEGRVDAIVNRVERLERLSETP